MESNIEIIRSDERGPSELGWLKSRHTFSFGEYYNPKRMHFGHIRVINDDWVAPATGFDLHPHKDMEIVTIVLEGQLEHRDSLGNGDVLTPGKIQAMSAGTGIYHSEKNPSQTDWVHLLQIWILTDQHGHAPRYQDGTFEWKINEWVPIVSNSPTQTALWIHQDAHFYLGAFEDARPVVLPQAGKKALVMVIEGGLDSPAGMLAQGDTALVSELGTLSGVVKGLTKVLVIYT